ncbi:hypothetical protein [Pontibacter kalidii]|uniref:hypothetical protein n=1 Tax=Pontibacter kalidii TaxID=2592049 RepID=UPI00224EF5C9|nr:hypothetical protein [Pontibacter kalidii]
MKNKLALLALACGLSFAAHAQTVEEETLKPVAGNKTLEATLNFSGGPSTQIKFRKFKSEQVALRYTTGISYSYTKPAEDASSSNLTLSFAPGFEKHFGRTRRLSPYLGFAVPIAVSTKSYKDDQVEAKGADSPGVYGNYNRSYFSAGVNGLAGVDLYIVKNFYVGFEAGIGLSYLNYADVEVKYKDDFTRNINSEGHYGLDFRTFTNGNLRIGFAF